MIGRAHSGVISASQQTPVAGGGSYPLDDYSGAVDAVSVFKLSSSYAGDCMEIERSSDNTTLDIGWSGDEVDTAAISTFCSGTTGRIRTWYNQGSHDDFVQTTHSNQPVVYISGALNTLNGFLAPYFGGSDEIPQATDYTSNDKREASTYKGMLSIVLEQDGTQAQGGPYGADAANSVSSYATYSNTIYFDFGSAANTQRISTPQPAGWDDAQHHLCMYGSTDQFIRVDGAQVHTESFTPSSITVSNTYRIGRYNTKHFKGYIQEVILWASDRGSDVTDIDSEVNGRYSIY